MTTKSRVLFLLSALVAIGLLLSSCSPPLTAQAPEKTHSEPEIPAATQAPAATEAPAAENPLITQAPAPAELPTSISSPLSSPAVLPTSPALNVATSPAEGEASGYAATATYLFPMAPVGTSTSHPPPLPTATVAAESPVQSPQPLPTAEDHTVQVEWPTEMRLGDSDNVLLTLIPSKSGFTLITEYPEHQTVTQTLVIQREPGYELFAAARLDGPGFEISPSGDQIQFLPQNQAITWRWSLTPRHAGRQRAALALSLNWMPTAGSGTSPRIITIYSKALEIQVHSIFGLTRSQAMGAALASLAFGGGMGFIALVFRPASARRGKLRILSPNPGVVIEPTADVDLSPSVRTLLQTLFHRYHRLVVEQEFLSGYSGARTLLVLPVRIDGRADAYTIAKIGERIAIQREFENYETYVKDTLPPITARIQHPPVAVKPPHAGRLAALQYTFIGEAGKAPVSLRQELLQRPNADWLRRLMETFGPNWWLQRRPYTFRLALEYDRLLPTHLVIEPANGRGRQLDGRLPPANLDFQKGDLVQFNHFPTQELRPDGRSLSLQGIAQPGYPPLRIRWLSPSRPEGSTGRVVAARADLLKHAVDGCELYGLPDPLVRLPGLLQESITGSQSTIHGDLNLENILIGPGGMLWLIDFASTRDGHTLLDFAHIGAQLVAHILAPQIHSPTEYVELLDHPLQSPYFELFTLLKGAAEMAQSCLFNPADPGEYKLSLALTCMGALKHVNLSTHTRHCLYLTAAYMVRDLDQREMGTGSVPGGAVGDKSASANASI